MDQNTYVHGEWNCICDRCGSKYKASQLRREWTGLMVCHGPGTSDCWEAKHPQLDIRAIPDKQSVPWARPEPTDTVLHGYNIANFDYTTGAETAGCLAVETQAIAGVGVAGCMVAGRKYNLADNDPVPSSSFNITDTIGS